MNHILAPSDTKDIVTRDIPVLNDNGVNSCNGPQNDEIWRDDDTISNDHDASIHATLTCYSAIKMEAYNEQSQFFK